MSRRGSLKIMVSVWKALILRESTVRLFGTRGAWAWLLIEPLTHFAFMTYLFAVIRQRHIGGIDITIWLILGLFGFFAFRRTANQMGGALDSNRALFTYRQVLPFDTIIVRGLLEGLIMLAALTVVGFSLWLFGLDIVPDDPLLTLASLFGLWLLGAALGLVIAVLGEVAAESRQVLNIMMMPLYFISGVIIPLTIIPPQYQPLLLFNPIVHGVEAARQGFSSFYHTADGISLGYLYLFATACLWLGLLLYRRFEKLVMTQ